MKKNKQKLIVLFGILLAVVTMIATYPLIHQSVMDAPSPSTNTIQYTDQIYDKAMISALPRYYELKKSENPEIQPYELFIKQNSDYEMNAIAQNITDVIIDEIQNLNTNLSDLKYYVTDKAQTSYVSNASEEEQAMMKAWLSEEKIVTENWYLIYSFDANGILSVLANSDSNVSASWISQCYNDALSSLFNSQNLRIYFQNEENNGSEIYFSQDENSRLAGPKDTTFIFTMTKDQLKTHFGYQVDNNVYTHYLYGEFMISYFALVTCALALFLWIFYCGTPTELPLYKLFKKIPFELHSMLAFILLPFVQSCGSIVKYTTANQHTFLTSGVADNMLETIGIYVLENGIFWFLIFGYCAYYFIAVKDIFKRKAWREYFITRKVLHWISVKWHNAITFIGQIDLTQKDDKRIATALVVNFIIMMVLILMWGFGLFFLLVYSLILFVIAKKYLSSVRHDYKNLLEVTKHIADGNLENEIETDLGMFNDFKDNMVDIRASFKQAVDDEVHSQRMKTELITNVSHDLKTPLTSIITYIDLLKKEGISEEERAKYIETLDRNSIRLKHLIDDLFEVSKANSGTMTLDLMNMDIVSLMKQVQFECKGQLDAKHLQIKNNFSDDKILCYMDPQKTYRIFENLVSNIAKYAMEYTRVYVDIMDYGNRVDITLRNISATEMNFDPEDITDRFTRGDASRNTEGSGLGLAIAKSFTELHDGNLRVVIDGDLFKVQLCFPKKEPESRPEV